MAKNTLYDSDILKISTVDIASSDDSDEMQAENYIFAQCPPKNMDLFLSAVAMKYNVKKEDIIKNIITRFFEAPPGPIWYHYEVGVSVICQQYKISMSINPNLRLISIDNNY